MQWGITPNELTQFRSNQTLLCSFTATNFSKLCSDVNNFGHPLRVARRYMVYSTHCDIVHHIMSSHCDIVHHIMSSASGEH